MITHDELPPPKKSKTQRKKEMVELQELGVSLIKLTANQLNQLPISETLRDALIEAKSIHAHGGALRQRQYIGRLMRNENAEEISKVLSRMFPDR